MNKYVVGVEQVTHHVKVEDTKSLAAPESMQSTISHFIWPKFGTLDLVFETFFASDTSVYTNVKVA